MEDRFPTFWEYVKAELPRGLVAGLIGYGLVMAGYLMGLAPA